MDVIFFSFWCWHLFWIPEFHWLKHREPTGEDKVAEKDPAPDKGLILRRVKVRRGGNFNRAIRARPVIEEATSRIIAMTSKMRLINVEINFVAIFRITDMMCGMRLKSVVPVS